MSPRGQPLTQSRVAELARGMGAVIVCARFEGVDERLIKARGLEEVSLGDFVLSGGEIAALALLDACVRLLPGVMGKEASAAEESFADGLLEYPQYTGRRCSRASRSRRCWFRATTPRLRPGGAPRPRRSPRPAAPTSGPLTRPGKSPKSGTNARVTRQKLCNTSSPTHSGQQ